MSESLRELPLRVLPRPLLRARRPALCRDEALPAWASSAVMAATAAGSIGVVAAWSR